MIALGIAKIPAEDSDDAATIRKRVAHHLKPLLEFAENEIRRHARRQYRPGRVTLFMGATGGMRDLEIGRRSRLQQQIRKFLASCPFSRVEYKTIPGLAEGIFGWVAANYSSSTDEKLPGQFGFATSPALRGGRHTFARYQRYTKGYIEMGGQTMQVAFSCNPEETSKSLENFRKIRIGPTKYDVFAYEWGDRGADAAWRKHLRQLYDNSNPADKIATVRLHPRERDNCLPKEAWDPDYPNGYSGAGNFAKCIEECIALVACQNGACKDQHPCLLSQLPQGVRSQLPKDLKVKGWVGAANFWYARRVLAEPDTDYKPIRLMREAAHLHTKDYMARMEAMKASNNPDHERLWMAVFNAVYTSVTLHRGFGVQTPIAQEVMMAADDNALKKSLGKEVAAQIKALNMTSDPGTEYTIVDPARKPWALGAALVYIHDPDCLRDLLKKYEGTP